MRSINLLLLIISISIFTNCKNSNSANSTESNSLSVEREYYQLKVYTFDSNDQVSVTDNYLKEAYLPGLKRAGINSVGVFKLRLNETDTIQKTFVLTPFKTIEQFLSIEDTLNNDDKYLIDGEDYIKASYNKKPYSRVESTLMRAFADFPVVRPSKLESPRSERIYELRSYESPTEAYHKSKVDMFNDGGEVKLFDHLEFNAVFYGEVISGSKMPNLMYMTTFSNRESRAKHWKAFGSSPEWKELSAMQKYKNSVSHADIMFLYPTEYSDY